MTEQERMLIVEFMLNINNAVSSINAKYNDISINELLIENHTILQTLESLNDKK